MISPKHSNPVLKAICVISRNGNEVLASLGHDNVRNEYFGRIIGGTVEFGETSTETLHREIQEELGTDITDLELVGTIENIFTHNGEPGHQVMFLYKGRLADQSLYARDDLVILDDPKVKLVWVPVDGNLKIYPEFDYSSLLKFN